MMKVKKLFCEIRHLRTSFIVYYFDLVLIILEAILSMGKNGFVLYLSVTHSVMVYKKVRLLKHSLIVCLPITRHRWLRIIYRNQSYIIL